MPPLKIENFGGMAPSRAPTLLPNDFAAYAQNTWLYHGTVQGFRRPYLRYTLANPTTTTKVYRIPSTNTLPGSFDYSTWMEFADPYTDVIRSPVIADSFSRYYFFSPSTAPQYNTLARILSSSSPYVLGVTAPSNAPTLTITGSATDTQLTRAYVYTWVTAYGEEGPPSPPVVQSNSASNTWQVNLSAPGSGDTTGRNLTNVNIYRTIANAQGTSSFFLVTTLPIATTTYVDTATDVSISGGTQLQSTYWTAPPNLQGCVSMPGGMLAGWANSKEIWFCEPYRPHAWPSPYTISLDYPIVGMAAVGQSLIVLTAGIPYVISGTTPATMTPSKVQLHEPCLSRHSIASDSVGVWYASANGLVLIPAATLGGDIASKTVFSRQDWSALGPSLFQGAKLGTAYISFVEKGVLTGGTTYDGATGPANGGVIDGLTGGNPIIDGLHAQFSPDANQGDNGFIVDGTGSEVAFSLLNIPYPVINTIQDEYTGEVLLLYNGGVYQWDTPSQTVFSSYTWRSKVFQFPYKRQFVGAKVFFNIPSSVTITLGARNTSQTQAFDPTSQYLLMRVFADGREVLVREVQTSGEQILFPSGFKADMWQFQFEGQVELLNFQAATSIKELQGI